MNKRDQKDQKKKMIKKANFHIVVFFVSLYSIQKKNIGQYFSCTSLNFNFPLYKENECIKFL